MKCRGVKKRRELVTRYCIFEEKKRERQLRKRQPLFVWEILKRKRERMIKSGNSDRCCGKVKLSKIRARNCSREF